MNQADKNKHSETDDATGNWQPSTEGSSSGSSDQPHHANPVSPIGESLDSLETTSLWRSDTNSLQRNESDIAVDGIPLPEIPGYEVLSRVAQGGMGVVYRARDLTLQRSVAIKMPRPGFINSQDDKQRFLLEAKSAARLRHPNICPIYEVREIEGQPFIAMAFIEGQTLKDWGHQQKTGPRVLAELMATLATAVQYAHGQGVLHRDLKPSNVIVDSQNNQPLLMDFGLAKDLGQEGGLTVSGEVLGTPAYMAPEQAAGKSELIGPASDIYALGVILYEMLSGSPPFRGSIVDILVKVQTEDPPSLRSLNKQLHPDLEVICQKAMAKIPADRYATAAEFAADLRRFAQGELIVARRQPWLRRVGRSVARNRLVYLLGGALAVVLLAVLIAVPWINSQLRTSQISRQFQAQLKKESWTSTDFEIAQQLLRKLDQESPAEASSSRELLVAHVNEWIDQQTKRGRLEDSDLAEIEDQIQLLGTLDRKLADKRLAELDARRGLWQRVATLEAPFANAQSLLPGVRRREDGQALLGPQTGSDRPGSGSDTFLAPAASTGNFQLQGTVLLPPESSVAFVIAATAQRRSAVTALAVSPSGEYFAAADSAGYVQLFKSATGEEVAKLPSHKDAVGGLAFSNDGHWLASSACDGQVHLIDVATRKLAQRFRIEIPSGPLTVYSAFFGPTVAFSADSQQLLAGSGDGKASGEIRRWHLPEGTPLTPLATDTPTPWVVHVVTSTETSRVAAATFDNRVQLWDLTAEKLLFDTAVVPALEGPQLTSLAIHPNGKTLAVASTQGIVQLVDENANKFAKLEGFAAGVYALAFDPKGKILAAGYESGTVKFWDPELRQIIKTIPDNRRRCEALAFDPHNHWLISGVEHGTVHRWDLASGQERYIVDGQGYRFLAERSREGRLHLQIDRGTVTLREHHIDLGLDPFELSARRDGDRLELQVNRLPPLIFRDYFPPRLLALGRWGVSLQPGAELHKLIVRQSNDVVPASPLEQGNAMLVAGEYATAIELFDQQAVDSGEDRTSLRNMREAQLKGAICMLRLNRNSEAIDRLRAISGGDAKDPAVTMARFILWDALIAREDWQASDQLFSSIRIDQTANQIAEVIPMEMRKRMLAAYSSPVIRRTGQLQAGAISRLHTSLEMIDYFQLPANSFMSWRLNYLAALRLNDEQAQADAVSQQLIQYLETEGLNGDIRRRSPIEQLDYARTFGSVSRIRGEPQRSESLLKVLLFNPQGSELLPDLKGLRLGLLVELARLDASNGNWQMAIDHLEPLLQKRSTDDIPREVLGEAAMLRGFAFRKLGQQEQAIAAWKNHPYPALDRPENMLSLSTPEIMQFWILRSLANDLSDAEAQTLAAGIRQRLAGSGGNINKVFEMVPINTAILSSAWRSRYGVEAAERIAYGNCLPMEASADVIQVGAHSLLCNGAFGDHPSAEQEQLARQLTQAGFRAFGNDELSFITISQVGLSWKGISPVFGTWKTLINQLPPTTRSSGAFILGCRFARREKLADARALWQLAQELAPNDVELSALIDAELAKLSQ